MIYQRSRPLGKTNVVAKFCRALHVYCPLCAWWGAGNKLTDIQRLVTEHMADTHHVSGVSVVEDAGGER